MRLLKCQSRNDGTRTLIESALVQEVQAALKDLAAALSAPVLLIGGLAVAYYARPRVTMDIDLLLLSSSSITLPLEGFKKTRKHGLMHLATNVEVELLDAPFLGLPQRLVAYAYSSASEIDGFLIPTKEVLIALKLQRFTLQDQADIESIVGENLPYLDDLCKLMTPVMISNWAEFVSGFHQRSRHVKPGRPYT